MTPQELANQLKSTKEYFDRSTRCLTEAHSSYKPTPDAMTAAQQVAHVGQTFDWFMDGAFHRPDGFDLDFDKHMEAVVGVESLADARAWLDRSVAAAIDEIGRKSMEELDAPLPEGLVMGGEPKHAVVGALVDHTAHHRGVLTVYSRMNGLVPPMPYMEM